MAATETLQTIFCKKNHKLDDYIVKVLLPEGLIKITMRIYQCGKDLAENFLFSNDCKSLKRSTPFDNNIKDEDDDNDDDFKSKKVVVVVVKEQIPPSPMKINKKFKIPKLKKKNENEEEENDDIYDFAKNSKQIPKIFTTEMDTQKIEQQNRNNKMINTNFKGLTKSKKTTTTTIAI
jgi:hypothetical protein